MTSIRKHFFKAVDDAENLKKMPSEGVLLDLYGLYKQVTVGDVNVPQPGFLNIKGRKKWNAWNKRKGMTTEAAMKKYGRIVHKLKNK